MYKYSVYLHSTGRILRNGKCSSYKDYIAQAHGVDEMLWQEMLDPDTKMIVNGKPADRPRLLSSKYSIIVDEELLLDLPVATSVDLDGETQIMQEDGLMFSSPVPGLFSLSITPPFPALKQTVRVSVDET